ncbi:zinc-finger domain-containing protein [Bacillus sp. DJP31]|uniref:zinc-finger domain-containing protein n=1 Tax=Bacillus sp. DJP31 TaxID=3409789 RepID=UPI003BB59FA5
MIVEQKRVLLEVSNLLDTFCENCFVNGHFKKEHGKCFAQTFCIKECTVGQQLKEYGKLLS